MIRVEAGMSTARFCKLIDMPERTWRRWQAKARQEQPPKGAAAAAGEGCRSAAGGEACVGEAGVGSPEDLGDDAARRAQGVAGDGAAAAA
ncbi:hypothetical protein [Microbacterium sp. EF45047]|uniref:hypothetical protein n=1 Tax=Microbacterium sp. EF45047 TaxID=2809708 RepID=UPI00234B32B3|nr:hypothetical protein [Microbacterium sp. EF45047]